MQYPGGAGEEFTDQYRMDQVANVPWTDITGFPTGIGTDFNGQAGNFNWFHFPIPTPVIVMDVRANVARVMFLFHSDPNQAWVDEVMLFDGPNRIPLPSPTPFGGDFSQTMVEGQNRLAVAPPLPVMWGVGLSIRVHFVQTSQIRFVGAGVDFEVN
jgi:hypothetical protein